MKKNTIGHLFVIASVFILLGVANVQAASVQAANPMILRAAMMAPATGTGSVFLQKACNEIEKLTQGRIKVEIYWSETLVKVREMPKAIQRGVCDIGWVAGAYNPSELPLWSHYAVVLYYPKGEDAGWIGRKAWEVFDTSKELRAEMENLNQRAWFVYAYDHYALFSKKIVKTLSDMRGMRIRVNGEYPSRMIGAIGANPTFLPASDTYSSLERGTVDGAAFPWESAKRYGLFEVVPYAIEINVFPGYCFMNVSLSTLAKMSEQDRKTFLEVGRKVSIDCADAYRKERDEYKVLMQGKGLKILSFPIEERSKWAEEPQVKVLIKKWIDDQTSAGRPGKEVMSLFLKTFELPQMMPTGY